MNDSCVAWMELDAFDVARLSGGCLGRGGVCGQDARGRSRDGCATRGEELDGHWDDEVAVHVPALGGQGVRLWHLHDEVWRTQLPVTGPLGHGREIGGVPFHGSFGDPLSEQAK